MPDRLNRLISFFITCGLILLVIAISPFRIDPLYSIKEDVFTLASSIIVFFGAIYISKTGFRENKPLLFFFLFVMYMALTFFFAENKYEWFKETFRLFLIFSILFITFNLNEVSRLKNFIAGGLVCAVIAATLGLLEYFGFKLLFAEEGKIISLFGHQNLLGQYLAVSLVWAVCAICLYPRFKVLSFAAFIIICAGLFVTTCRSGWVSAGICVILIFLTMYKKKQMPRAVKTFSILLTVTCAIIFAVYVFADLKVVSSRENGFISTSFRNKFINNSPLGLLSGRDTIWKTSFAMFLKKPLTGYGAGNYWIAYPSVDPPFVDYSKFVHNDYLQILTEGGIIGFGLFFIALILGLLKIFRFLPGEKDRFIYYSFLSSLIVVLIDSFFSYDLYVPVASYIFAVSFGVLLNISYADTRRVILRGRVLKSAVILCASVILCAGSAFFAIRNIGFYNYFYGVMSITDNLKDINPDKFTPDKIKNAGAFAAKAEKYLPYEPEILFFDLMLSLGEGDFNLARDKGDKLIKLTPYEKKTLLIMAKIEAILGNEGSSKKYYARLSANNNIFASKYVTDMIGQYGSFYDKIHSDVFERGSADKMLSEITSRINSSKDNPAKEKYLRYIRATILIKLGKWTDAIDDLTICGPDNYPSAYMMRAMAHSKKGGFIEAESDFNKYLEFDKKSETAYLGRGIARLKMGKTGPAESDFKSVLMFNKNNYKALRNLGIIKLSENDTESARKYFQMSLNSAPNQPGAKEIEELINKLKTDSKDNSATN